MNEYLFLSMARLGPQRLVAEINAERAFSARNVGPRLLKRGDVGRPATGLARTAQLAAVVLSVAINLGAFGLLQWELSEVAPRGEVHIVELGTDASAAYAQVAAF